MCLKCHECSCIGSIECASEGKENSDYSCRLSHQLSTVSMSESSEPNFVYLRRKQQGKAVAVFSAEAPASTKRCGEDCLSVISSDAPSVAANEVHAASQSERTSGDPVMPSTVCDTEPGALKSESINGFSLVEERGSKRTFINSGYNFVYRRKKLKGNPVSVFSAEVPCLSVASSDSPSVAVKDLHVASQSKHTNRDTFIPSTICRGGHSVLKSESMNGCFREEEKGFDEASKSMRQKIIEADSINDSCSSSMSDTELVSASMQTEVDDSGECSSSSVMAAEFLEEDMSEKDLCVSLIRSQGVLEGLLPNRAPASDEGVGDSSVSSSRSCKICSHPESTLKMLICDNCEEAFHLFCCNPRIKRIPIDEWFCHSCAKKRRKILKESISKSSYMISERGRCGNSEGEKNPIALMLRDTGPYRSAVRCGKGFQAEVPEWSGPVTDATDIDPIAEPLEMNPSDFIGSTELNTEKPSKLSFISNWLQCREFADGAGESSNGTICGKWRRAPLFEVQTANWECFCSVLWDPVHADCAVPQELDTDEVLKQLKYRQMLRPKLDAERQKLECMKNDNDSMDVVKQEQRKSHQQDPSGTIMYRRHTHGCKNSNYQK